MIEIRYRVVNKWLREIRDIDVQESSVKGNAGSFGVTTPLHCKVGEYLNTNLTFHHNSFQTSLNSGLLRTYLQKGDIVQVWYDTELKKEVDSPYGQPQPAKTEENDQVTAMAKIFKDAGITADDLKDIVSAFKAKKQGIAEQPKETVANNEMPHTTTTNTKRARKVKTKKADKPVNNSKTVVDNFVIKPQEDTPKNTENSIQSAEQAQPVDNSGLPVNNSEQENFKSLGYQAKLKAIKESSSVDFLQWVLSNFTQTAIFNAVNKRLEEIQNTTPKVESK